MAKLLLIMAAAATAFAQTPLVNNVGNFIHDVADLDRSVKFYHDVIGMDLPRPAGDWQTTDAILKMYDAEGAKFRVVTTQIPGSPMRVEMVQFSGVEQKPVKRAWGAPGTSVLMLTATDLAPIEQRVKESNTPIVAMGTGCLGGREIVVQDPDGFAVMIVERKGSDRAKGNLTGSSFGYLVSGNAMAKTFAALGLPAKVNVVQCEEDVRLLGKSPSVITTQAGFDIWLMQASAKGALAGEKPRDPGAGVLRLAVSDVDKAIEALKGVNVNVVSVGGVPVTLAPGTTRAAILRAPDDLLIQVVK